MKFTIFPLGDNALTISFGNIISPKTNDQVFQLADFVEKNRFAGFVETVPAYSSLSIFYNVSEVRKTYQTFSTAFEFVKNFVENSLDKITICEVKTSRLIQIPMSFDKNFALDLEELAEHKHLSIQEVIEIFTSQTYRVFMLGFLPGFAYMGEVDERIATPRKQTPRLKVPKGSVGIAGNQTGIYPLESPGGWNIIGKTELEMFTMNEENPSFLRAGDLVKFVANSFNPKSNLNHSSI
jgi:inhibitor of KinA